MATFGKLHGIRLCSLGTDSLFARLNLQLERDGFRLNRHRALDYRLRMIFSENRYPLFRIMR